MALAVDTSIPLSDWGSVPEAARAAEAAGFDGVMTPEIHNDPFVPLAFAATATERIRLSTAVAIAFPRSPMITAYLANDLHRESGGRFVLGLGTQVKGHNERRYSVEWKSPGPRIREYVEALRAIWRTWEHGEPLRFEGEHYRFSLMTPEFSPPPTGLGPIPVTIAAVQPYTLRVSGEVCDGVRLHGFCTRRYVEEVAMPAIDEGLARAARPRERFEVWGGGFVATGANEDEVRKAMNAVRYRIAFYGSTRSYAGVMSLHGWDDLAAKLHRMSIRGEWDSMAAEVGDDVVREFAAVGTYDEIAARIRERFEGVSDRIALDLPGGTDAGVAREILADVHSIPSKFEGWATVASPAASDSA